MDEHPVGIVVDDDLRRSRLTVFFRLLLVIPHAIWLVLWSVVVILTAIAAWFATLATGRLPAGLHRFFCSYIRYGAHVFAYIALVANPYPDFTGTGDAYPFDLRLPAEPEPQPRWRVAFRLVLAIPSMLIAAALGGGGGSFSTSSRNGGSGATTSATGLAAACAVLGWFASVFRGRMPRGLRDGGAYAIGYRSQVAAYLLLVTPRYPDASPAAMLAGVEPPPIHPVRLARSDDDLRRSRVTVFFRLPLAVPHLVWLVLWTIVAILAGIAQWVVTLVRGRPAAALHAFLGRYVRYSLHVQAFLWLVANPFPGFAGREGSYPLDVELPPPGRQGRWKTGFRILLAIPALVVDGALGTVLAVDGILTWFAALFTGRAPGGLRSLSVYALRYGAQLSAYVFLVTDVYPHASPLEGAEAGTEDEADEEPAWGFDPPGEAAAAEAWPGSDVDEDDAEPPA